MLNRKKDPTPLESVTLKALEALNDHKPNSDEYGVILERVETLHKMQQSEKTAAQVSPETKATIAANLIGIAMILNFERANIVTSKAIGFVLRAR
jgi:hypothetical protein